MPENGDRRTSTVACLRDETRAPKSPWIAIHGSTVPGAIQLSISILSPPGDSDHRVSVSGYISVVAACCYVLGPIRQ